METLIFTNIFGVFFFKMRSTFESVSSYSWEFPGIYNNPFFLTSLFMIFTHFREFSRILGSYREVKVLNTARGDPKNSQEFPGIFGQTKKEVKFPKISWEILRIPGNFAFPKKSRESFRTEHLLFLP